MIVALATLAVAAGASWLSRQGAIDHCLDKGGAWYYVRKACTP